MLWDLVVLWLLGFFAFPIAGLLTNLLLVIVVAVLIAPLVMGRRRL